MALSSNVLKRGQRYALILVDLSVGFTDPTQSPMASESDDVVEANRVLLERFRERGWPVFFTTVAYSEPSQASVFREKLPALNVLEAGSGLVEIDPRLQPRSDEPVLVKHWASGFFGTDLEAPGGGRGWHRGNRPDHQWLRAGHGTGQPSAQL